jgi:cellulose/xylan binding protein with CBM9 domain
MKKTMLLAMAAFVIGIQGCLMLTNPHEVKIKFEELKGARRINHDSGNWEIGFGGENYFGKFKDLKGLKGIIRFKNGKLVNQGKAGIELPCLNISSDMRIYGKCKELISNENKDVTVRDIKKRVQAIISSHKITGPHSNVWNYEDIIKTATTSKQNVALVPATWFDVKGNITTTENAAITLKYLDKNNKQIEFAAPLDPGYVNRDGSTRIGFYNIGLSFSWYTSRSCYVIQASKNKGRVIGKISVSPMNGAKYMEKVELISGSIKICQKKLPPFLKTKKILHELHIYHTATDFDAFELSRFKNCVSLIYIVNWIPVSLWGKYPEKVKTIKAKSELVQQGIDNFHKYGVDVVIASGMESIKIDLDVLKKEFPQFIPEKLKKNGTFELELKVHSHDALDEMNPKAMEFLELELGKFLKALLRDVDYFDCQPERRFFSPYNYMKYPFYSKAALKNYRKFYKNPELKFPTTTNVPNTERTFNNPTAKDWVNYYNWRTKYHTDWFLSWAKAGWNAFKSEEARYKGAFVVDSAGIALKDQPHGVDLERLFASKYIALYVAEYIRSKRQPSYPEWLRLAKKYNKKWLILLDGYMFNDGKFLHKFPVVKNARRNVVENVLSSGVDVDTDGFSTMSASFNMITYDKKSWCKYTPEKNVFWPMFRAMYRKYFNYGNYTLEQSDNLIKKAMEKSKIHFDPKGKKKIKIPLNAKVKVDGNPEEWNFQESSSVDNAEQIIVGDKKAWKGKDDFSCVFALAVDDNNFYFSALVKDDHFVSVSALKPTAGGYADEVNLMFSFEDPRKKIMTQNQNSFQLRFLPDKKEVLYGNTMIKNSKVVFKKQTNGYSVEACIPLENFNFAPKAGDISCVDIFVMDADDVAKGVKTGFTWNAKYKPWQGPMKNNGWGIAEFVK